MWRWWRRREMWRAIQEACANEAGMWTKRIHPIHGLRAIRDFERINRVQFDPFNALHRSKTYHQGRMRCGLCILRKLYTDERFWPQ